MIMPTLEDSQRQCLTIRESKGAIPLDIKPIYDQVRVK